MTASAAPKASRDIRVSVVIPARNAASVLKAAVGSALADSAVDELIIAVGPSTDATRAVADELAKNPRVEVVDNPDGTTPTGLNRAITAARGDIIVRVDAQSQLVDGYVTRAVETLVRTGAANVGGRQVPVATTGFGRAVAAAMRSPAGSGGAAYRSADAPEGPVDTVYLGVFDRDALEAVGFFDETMLRNQDAELNARLRAHGYQVWFNPQLAVEYQPRQSLRTLASQYFQYGRWRRVTARRYRSLRLRQLAAPAIVAVLTTSIGVAVATRNARIPALVGGSYLAAVTCAAAAAADDVRDAPSTALALVTMHLAWGVGFLIGPPRSGVDNDSVGAR